MSTGLPREGTHTVNEKPDVVVGQGFWLPCGAADFFDPREDRDLAAPDGKPRRLHDDAGDPVAAPSLECSTFHRLCRVLGHRRYESVVPIYNGAHADDGGSEDPVAALFCSRQPHRQNGDPVSHALTNTVLIVDADGFYYWLAAARTESATADALRDHIVDAVGGDFFSHFSGRPADARHLGTALDEAEQYSNLTDYRDKDCGMLTFFQVNTILEGLYNASFDPRIFFPTMAGDATEGESPTSTAKREYSVGNFIRLILTPATTAVAVGESTSPGVDNSTRRPLAAACRYLCADTADSTVTPGLSRRVYRDGLPARTRHDALQSFLHAAAIHSLADVKARLERSRRALLDDLLGVTHRRFPLVQVESPDEKPDAIPDATEGQLRGYVMMMSAKLPLLVNVDRHVHYLIERDWQEPPSSQLHADYEMWRSLLTGIGRSLAGLESSITQASADRMLYEQEQARAATETMAELQRLGHHDDGGGGGVGGHSGELEAFFASTALLVTVGAGAVPPPWREGVNLFWFIPAVIVMFFASFALVRSTTMWVRRKLADLHWLSPAKKFLYELDLRLDLHIRCTCADLLLSGGDLTGRATTASIVDSSHFVRNSYRVERLSEDHAIHKIHLDGHVRWSGDPPYVEKRFGLRVLGTDHRMALHVVYEIEFQRYADPDEFLLRELRVIATHRRALKRSELDQLRTYVAKHLVNSLLSAKSRPLDLEGASKDALVESCRRPPGHVPEAPTPS